ncbi:accessory gland protein Acp29AB [Drosophila kikkawai]|uniref:Accessory gland protein Acp29AB n=1 Tax=Drosophila kikkawai TaxID=30033 RepID=A0A6P4I4F8_DROKI|nr:accessory gland protein Acp29AB-like [Drosophila kikkawai]
MFKCGTYIFLVVWSLRNVSLAEESLRFGYVCLLDEPNPNHCDSFCLNTLLPLLSQIAQGQEQENSLKTETKESLDLMKSQQTKIEDQLRSHMESQLKVQAKLEADLLELQTKLDGKLQTVQTAMENRLQAMQTNLEGQLQAIMAKMNESIVDVADRDLNKVPSDFKRIGSRYFRVIEKAQDWTTAGKTCQTMKGYLASIQNEDELTAISANLKNFACYWLGINDRYNEGHYVSVASNRKAEILKWKEGEPNDKSHEENCVLLIDGKMADYHCNASCSFICQADNKI